MIWLLAAVAVAAPPLVSCPDDPEKGALVAFELLVVDATPSAVGRFADCLEHLGLPHVAQRHWIEVLRAGDPVVREVPEALGRAVTLAEELGDLWSVQWAIGSLDEAALHGARAAGDALLYVHAQHLLRHRDHRMAAEVLQEMDPGFRWYPESLLVLGKAWEGAGQRDLAVETYRRIVALPTAPELVVDMAVMRSARLFAEQQQLDTASVLLGGIAATSPLYGPAQTVGARMWLDEHQQEVAGDFLRQARQAERRGALLPQLGLLQARVALDRCRPRGALRTLDRWEQDQERLLLVVKGVVDTGSADGAVLFERHLGPGAVDVGLPPSVRERLEVGHEFRWLATHLAKVDEEELRIRQLGDARWQATIGEYLIEVIAEGRQVLRRMAGDLFAAELRALQAEVERDLAEAREMRMRLEDGSPGC